MNPNRSVISNAYTSLSVPTQLALCSLFYLSTVLPHAWFGTTLNNWVFSQWSRSQYDTAILSVVILWVLLTIIFIFRNFSKLGTPSIIHLIFSLLLGGVIWKTGFVINIEAIHFIQYGILAILLFPITKEYLSTHLWCLILGILDEAYQYFYLAPDATFYFDMNDVITNVAGAGFGIFFWMAMRRHTGWTRKNHILPIAICLFLAGTLLLLYIFLDPNHPLAVLKKPIVTFWTPIEGATGYFHIIGIREGIILVTTIMVIYDQIYRWISFRSESSNSNL